MSNIENKLVEYRARKERKKESTEVLLQSDGATEDNDTQRIETLSEIDSLKEEDAETLNCCTYVDCIYYVLWLSLWATLYAVFIMLQFGTVYIIVSGVIGICYNTRTGPKKKDEISAYSVFNKDCKSIDGTLKAEQFEREIRYGPAVVR